MNSALPPLVSVIIPTYNHAPFLREALESLVAQVFPDWEALVINNYSTDDTLEVVHSFNDPRIRVENFRNNGVIGASRNLGIRLSRGKYIAFLDSDDKWHPGKLSCCIGFLERGADLVCHWLRCIGESNALVKSGPKERASFEELLVCGSCIVTSATLVRRTTLDSVGGFSEEAAFITSEDYHLWIKLAKANANMVFIKTVLGEYRVHAGNYSRAALSHMNSALSVVSEFLPTDSSGGFSSWQRARRCNAGIYYGAGRALHSDGLYRDGLRQLFAALRQWPLQPRIWAAIGLSWVRVIEKKLSAR